MATKKRQSARASKVKLRESSQRHWSYSSWSTFSTCRLKYYYQYIERRPTQVSYAMARGTATHAKAEQFALGKLKGGVPPELSKFESEFKALLKRSPRPLVEEWVRLDKDWKPLPEKAPAFFVGRLDLRILEPKEKRYGIIDHKTGRFRPTHFDQGDLYTVAAHALMPEAESAWWEFWYLDYGEVKSDELSLRKMKTLREKWHDRGMQVVTATTFEATPSSFGCRYCDFRSDKGGPCAKWRDQQE